MRSPLFCAERAAIRPESMPPLTKAPMGASATRMLSTLWPKRLSSSSRTAARVGCDRAGAIRFRRSGRSAGNRCGSGAGGRAPGRRRSRARRGGCPGRRFLPRLLEQAERRIEDPQKVDLGRAGGEQRLHLGGEEGVVLALPKEERLDAQPVAGQGQAPRAGLPPGKGEHAAHPAQGFIGYRGERAGAAAPRYPSWCVKLRRRPGAPRAARGSCRARR